MFMSSAIWVQTICKCSALAINTPPTGKTELMSDMTAPWVMPCSCPVPQYDISENSHTNTTEMIPPALRGLSKKLSAPLPLPRMWWRSGLGSGYK